MWYGIVVTENPGMFNERKVLLRTGLCTDGNLTSRFLLEELEWRAIEGWSIFSNVRQEDDKRIWSLVKDGKVVHLEIKTLSNTQVFIIILVSHQS